MALFELPKGKTFFVTFDDGKQVPLIEEEDALRKNGVCRVEIPFTEEEREYWSKKLSQVTPSNITSEGDGEYAFYRNILDEPDFPLDRLLSNDSSHVKAKTATVASILEEQFGCASTEFQIDDAFCIHYDMSQHDTTCAKHTDPSDVTLNMCFHCSEGIQGSEVLFYNSYPLARSKNTERNSQNDSLENINIFAVKPQPGYATLHWGYHPHQTLPLLRGERTNIVVTFCYKDKQKSTVSSRTCYAPDCA